MNEQVAELAAEGYSEYKIASVTGVKLATIKEIMATEEVKLLIDKFRARPQEEVTNRRYDRIENLALTALEENIAMAELPVALKVLDTINKRREIEKLSQGGGQSSVTNNTVNQVRIVNISLPERLIPEEGPDTTMTLNEKGEIVAVGGRSFAALSNPGVKEVFGKIASNREKARKIIHGVSAEDF